MEDVAALLDAKAKADDPRTLQEEVSMHNRERRMKVRLIKPNGEMAFTQDFKTSSAATLRYARLVEACVKDHWIGARVQCLDIDGKTVYERVISK